MNSDLSCLCDPENGKSLISENGRLYSGRSSAYLIHKGIPRFVSAENYSYDFGTQWNMFPKTQLDSFNGYNYSELRLARCLRGNLETIRDKMVLEAGCGAGRFTEILLKHGAVVHSFDYSNAVEANAVNNGHHEKLVLVQANILKIPFPKANYDYVICLGVLQHTPDPEESISHLWEMVKPGGALVVDHYLLRNWRDYLPPPFGGSNTVYRQIILRLPRNLRFKCVKALTDFWFPLHWQFKDSSLIQRLIRILSPIFFYYPEYILRDRKMYYEMALLDTHDGMTDYYKHSRKPWQIRKLLENYGAIDIVVEMGGNGVEAFGRKGEMPPLL